EVAVRCTYRPRYSRTFSAPCTTGFAKTIQDLPRGISGKAMSGRARRARWRKRPRKCFASGRTGTRNFLRRANLDAALITPPARVGGADRAQVLTIALLFTAFPLLPRLGVAADEACLAVFTAVASASALVRPPTLACSAFSYWARSS